MAGFYQDNLNTIEGLKKIVFETSQVMKKNPAEITKLKKKVKDQEAELIRTQENHLKKLEEVLNNAKKDAAIAIFEARVKMAAEAVDMGFDASIWDLQTWQCKLMALKCRDPVMELGESSEKVLVAETEVADKVAKDGDILGDDGKFD